MSDYHYQKLLQENIGSEQVRNDIETRKRRKIGNQNLKNSSVLDGDAENKDVITVSDSDQDSDDSINSSDFEDVSLDNDDQPFDLVSNDMKSSDNTEDVLSITIHPVKEKKDTKKVKKFTSISKEEREMRKVIHQMYLGLMICHGSVRNKWCNDYKLLMELKKYVSPQVLGLLHQKDSVDVLPIVKSRRFLDGLKKLMNFYSTKFRVTSKGLIRKNWNELSIKQTRTEANVTFERFFMLVTHFRGSHDIGAQGFVSLLRSVGLNARLIFSLQPPDFTSIAEFPKIDVSDQNQKVEETPKPKDNLLLKKFAPQNNKRKILASMREKTTTVTDNSKSKQYFEHSPYPIFWAEVWDKYVKKWVSIDPIELQTIEVPPMRRKSKFEPPATDTRNQLNYVIAYDRLGGVKDVTRRYSLYYNAKTVKKKIHFRSEEDENWYNRLIRASCLELRRNKVNKLDILESKEFYTRDLAEGVPNNIADFKNHPVYALESQLKQTEIIFPKDETSTCGFFRNKLTKKTHNKGQEVIPIYKRSHVYPLKSSKAWYMQGRVLKVGVQPLKLKKKQTTPKNSDDEDEDEETTRLYAEFQTKLYKPPPIVNGIIPKNAYGNIDIYTSTMLPDNGYLLETDSKHPIKIMEKAAKILEIDYAKAIVAFDFGKSGKKKSHNRNPTAREGGILVDIQYKEAICLVLNCLIEEEEDLRQRAVEMNSLKNWKYFLTKLRISARLNKEHGKLENDELDINEELENDKSDVYSDNSEGNMNDFGEGGGGFFVDTNYPNDHNTDYTELDGTDRSINSVPVSEKGMSNQEENSMFDGVEKNSEELGGMYSGGGFFVEDNDKHQDYHGEEKSSPGDVVEDIPEEFFKYDENGELIYDPVPEKRESSSEDAIKSHAILMKNPELTQENLDVTNLPKKDALTTRFSADIEVPSKPILIERNSSEVIDIQSLDEHVNLKSPSEQNYLVSLSDQASQESLVREIADQEQEFGFEYSDSD